MDPRTRKDVIQELSAHIQDLVRMNNGNVNMAMVSLEPPAEVARRYKQLYGYGTVFKMSFVILAGIVAAFTLPVIQIRGGEVTIPVMLSLLFLAILVAVLILVALKAGKNVGLAAGLVACGVRLGLFGYLYAAGGSDVVVEAGGAGLFLAVSILLILLGYIPGEAKARWAGPKGEI